MTRQVIPSMLLSILIVCFFSVLLYEREKPPRAATPDGTLQKSDPGTKAGAPSSPDSERPEQAQAPGAQAGPASGQGPVSKPETQPAPIPAVEPAPERPIAPSSSPDTTGKKEDPPPSAVPAPSPASQARSTTVETPSTNDPAKPDSKPAPVPAPDPPAPRSAFTTAKEGESLEDIAIRVYGSTDQANALWRANRDSLPTRTSPIKAGSILRTPQE